MLCKKIAKVALENTALSFDKLYDYLVPEPLGESVFVGGRVLAPFGAGNKKRQGFVFDILELDDLDGPLPAAPKLKAVSAALDKAPLLNSEMLELAFYLSDRTFCTLFEAAKAMLPPGLCINISVTYIMCPDIDKSLVETLPEDERLVCSLLIKRGGYVKKERILAVLGFPGDSGVCEKLAQKGFIVPNTDAARRVGDLSVRMASISADDEELEEQLPLLTQKQKSVIGVLRESGGAEVREICYLTGVTPSVIFSLQKKGLLGLYDRETFRRPAVASGKTTDASEINLSGEQEKCFKTLRHEYYEKSGHPALLYGVTGSGKTSVYLKMIDEVLAEDKGVIVMVPEIALTPQTLSIFYSRYGERVAVFHSSLSLGERLDEWKRVKSGEARIAVGTRSAVFAPFEKISLIIIDEEQEHTYKSEMSPRYNARDVARFRCAYNGALLLLASATPSIESYSAALAGRYTLCELTGRYGGAELPEVIVADMSDRANRGSAISSVLFELIEENLNSRRQTILLMNRRGHNTFVACTGCKNIISCPSCSISLIYHSANNRLMCHYCGYSVPYAEECPVCSQPALRYGGYGTQRVEADLREMFPDARILRMDADTTRSKNSHEEKLGAFAKGEYDILLGTQMVAKGLDFPNVTLVGVISVDQQLYNDDYKSMERTFDLLTQVVGRSGRGGVSGRAVLQTLMPENEVIRLAARQDYKSFYNMEIAIRRAMIYPPYCDICVAVFVGGDETLCKNGAKYFLLRLGELNRDAYADQKLIVLGPMPLRVAKVSGKYRYRLIIKCKNTRRFREFMRKLLADFSRESAFSRVSVFADINPEHIN